MGKKTIGLIGAFAIFAMLPGVARAEPVKIVAADKLPALITMTSYTEGTVSYSWTAGFRQALEDNSP